MTRKGVILYGPPGAGKDTITASLTDLRMEYTLFQRLKAGPGRTTGYRLTSPEHIEELSQSGLLLYANTRYGARYAIDRDGLSSLFNAGRIPVLHMGQVVGVDAVEAFPAEWVKVLLWCSRDTTAARCEGRGDKDVDARLKVWDETRRDLANHSGSAWSLIIDTATCEPTESAARIDRAVTSGPGAGVRFLEGQSL